MTLLCCAPPANVWFCGTKRTSCRRVAGSRERPRLPSGVHRGAVGAASGGSAGDPGEDAAVDLPGFLQVQKMADAVDDDHAGGGGRGGARRGGPAGPRCSRHRPRAGRGWLRGRARRARRGRSPVVADRSGQVRGLPQGLFDPGQVPTGARPGDQSAQSRSRNDIPPAATTASASPSGSRNKNT